MNEWLYDELLKIENKIKGNEFFSGGIAYYVSFDSVENTIFDYLLKCRAITEETDVKLQLIEDYEADIRNLLKDWHMGDYTEEILNCIKNSNPRLYKCCKDFEYNSWGSVGSIFRFLVTETETIAIEFYEMD